MTTVTQWFSIDDDGQPVHPGIYEIRYALDSFHSRYLWNGTHWMQLSGSSPTFFGNADTKGEKWRGLAEKPA